MNECDLLRAILAECKRVFTPVSPVVVGIGQNECDLLRLILLRFKELAGA